MPQLQLPIFPQGMTLINANLGFMRKGNSLTYFYGHMSVFTHDADDQRSFRMITSQFYANGSAKQAEICRAFGVSPISVKRHVKLYRRKGIAGFFEEPRRRGAAVLTPPVLQEVQGLLDEGWAIPAQSPPGWICWPTRSTRRYGPANSISLKKKTMMNHAG
jgi:transposase-like protein